MPFQYNIQNLAVVNLCKIRFNNSYSDILEIIWFSGDWLICLLLDDRYGLKIYEWTGLI